jgi:hypothetical protein
MSSKPNPMYDMSPPPLQIPEATPVAPRSFQAETQTAPPGGNKAGGAANIAANFLHGMLAGKDVKERKMQETAQFSISSAWQTYQQLQATASDPSAPEDARKMATANLGKAYQVWINNVEQYTQPGGQPKKKGIKGVMSRMGGALTAQKPTMGTEDMLELYKSPQMIQMMSQPHGPSPEQQIAQIQLQQTKKASDQMDAIDAQTKTLTESLGKDMSSDDNRSKAVSELSKLQALKGELKDVPDPLSDRAKKARDEADVSEAKLKGKLSDAAMVAYDKKQQGLPLSPTEERLLSAYLPEGKTDPFQIYQNMIGKRATNKLTGREMDVKDDRDALDLYLSDQAYWAKVGKNPTEYEQQSKETKDAIRSSLRGEYGREPSDDEVRSKWLNLTYGSKKEDKPRQIPTAEKSNISQSIYNDMSSNDRWKEFVEPGTGKGSLRLKPRSQVAKDRQSEYDDMLQHVGSQLKDRGFSDEDIREVTGSPGFGPSNMSQTPPSMSGKISPKGVGPTKKYKVSSGSQSTEEEMTQQEADEMKKANPNWKVEESGGQGTGSPAGGL